MSGERIFALRGAAQASANERDAILTATDELLRELIRRNDLELTPDLDAEFPAVAARRLGLDAVPLLCAREIAVPDAMERVIRTMLHYYAPSRHVPSHVYLGPAAELRSDLGSAQ